jgi:UDP-glucose 4-epimerase
MQILVTGAFGFLGGRIAQSLSNSANTVILGSGRELNSPEWLPDVRTVQMKWENQSSLQKICKGIDVIIHCAGVNAQDSQLDPVNALKYNGLYTSSLVEAAKESNVSTFIYLSTAHVYSNPLEGTITDSKCPGNLHPYATSHLAGEQSVLYAGLNSNMTGIVLRLSNCFGKPVHKEANCWMLLVNDLCRQAVEEKSLTLRSNGKQLRDFISIKSLCEQIEFLLISKDVQSDTNSFVLNVSSGVSMQVSDMAGLIQKRCEKILGYKPDLKINAEDTTIYPKYLTIMPSEIFQNSNEPDNKVQELDELLTFCKKHFSESN